MTTKEKLWRLSIDWFEACEGYTVGPAADRHWTYLFLWAAPLTELLDDQTHE